jgi:hypothetical protein
MRTLALVLMVGIVGVVGLSGCAGSRGGAEPRAEDAATDPLGRGEERPASAEGLAVERVFPFIMSESAQASASGQTMIAVYDVVEGQHSGEMLEVWSKREGDAQRWWVERRIASEGGKGRRLERRVQEVREGPAVYLVEFWNDERGVRVVFEPDPLTMPAVLVAGETVSTEQKMTLPTIQNPKKIRERGTGRMELTYVGDQMMVTPFGTLECAKTREVYTSKLKNATAVRTMDRWYAAEIGLVAERWEETVTILGGVVVERTVHAMRLRERPRLVEFKPMN